MHIASNYSVNVGLFTKHFGRLPPMNSFFLANMLCLSEAASNPHNLSSKKEIMWGIFDRNKNNTMDTTGVVLYWVYCKDSFLLPVHSIHSAEKHNLFIWGVLSPCFFFILKTLPQANICF